MTEKEAATPQDPHHCDNPDHKSAELTYVHEVESEKRHLRFWLIKVTVVVIAVCVVVVVGMTAYSTLVKGEKFDSSPLAHFVKGIGAIIDALE